MPMELLGPHLPLLLGLARKLCHHGGQEPEDLVQDTLERALRHRVSFQGWSEERRRAWLCVTLQRRFLDGVRRQRLEAREAASLELVRAPVLVREPREWDAWERISEEALDEAIEHLRPALRDSFGLHRGGLSYKTIAERLGTTPGTVGFWLHQARRELRAWLRPLALS